jgi:dye decolorizing peroxidase
VTRRDLLVAGGAALVGAAGGLAVGRSTAPAPEATTAAPAGPPAPPDWASLDGHQPGIATAPPVHQWFLAFDLVDDDREAAAGALRLLDDSARRLWAGEPILADAQPELAAPVSLTVGLGHGLFERLDLTDRVPPAFPRIPAFSTDALDARWSGGDIIIQVAADDPTTLAHAARMVQRDLAGLLEPRWEQRGFRGLQVSPSGATRNLMGQVDGTVNPHGDDLDTAVWLGDGPAFARGGTVLVLRRVRLLLDDWDILDRAVQETVMGRRLDTGAPLGAESEQDPVPWDAVDSLGLPVVDLTAHIRVAHAATVPEMILRRGYSYDDRAPDGTRDAGLLFAAYTSDPRRSFIPMQQRLAERDAFNRWNVAVGSATFLMPGQWSGEAERALLA